MLWGGGPVDGVKSIRSKTKHQFDFGGGGGVDLVAIGVKVALLSIPLGTAESY